MHLKYLHISAYFTVQSNANLCSRISDDLSLINFIIAQVVDSQQSTEVSEYHTLLQFIIFKHVLLRKIPQIKALITCLIEDIISKNTSEEDKLPKLVIVFNVISCAMYILPNCANISVLLQNVKMDHPSCAISNLYRT